MSYVMGFVPWLAYFVIAVGLNPSRDTMLLAAVVGFVLTLAFLVPSIRAKTVNSLEIGALVFFPIMFVLAFVLPPETLEHWGPVLGQLGLTLSVGIGLLVGRPFTLTFARAATPQALWDYPSFIASGRRITLAWFLGFLAMTVLKAISLPLSPTSIGAILLNWVAPIVIIIGVVRWMIGYIKQIRADGEARLTQRLAQVIPAGGQMTGWLDHVTTVQNPADAKVLFDALASLGLVVPWAYKEYPDFATGGVRLGNLNIEVIGTDSEWFDPQFVTFEPVTLKGLADELERRGIRHSGELPTSATVEGKERTIYTRVDLPELSEQGDLTTQYCVTWSPVRTWSPTAPPNEAGIVSVKTVAIHVPAVAMSKYRSLLAPDGGDHLSQGPEVILGPAAEKAEIAWIDVVVADPERAVAACKTAGIPALGTTATVGSLHLRFSTA